MESRFNKVLRDWENWFVISRVRHIENLDLMNLRKNSHVRYIVGWLIDFFVVSGSSIESLVSIIIFDHRTWQRTQDCWLQEQTCELKSLSADDTGTTNLTPFSNSLLKIEVVLSTNVRSFFCQISSIAISLVCSQYLWGSYLTKCDNNLRQQFKDNNFFLSVQRERENCKAMFNVTTWYPSTTE